MSDADVIGWVSLAYARRAWPDAGKMSEPVLTDLLTTSHEMCTAYLPADELAELAELPAVPPSRWQTAQVAYARQAWTAMRANGAGTIGVDEYAPVEPPPLAAHVKALLRPRAGIPMVG